MNTMIDERHLTDAELVRVLDREPLGSDEAERLAHLDACDRCADALAALRAESGLVTRFLERADFEEDGAARLSMPDASDPATVVSDPERPGSVQRPAGSGTDRERRPGPARARFLQAPTWLKAAAILVLVAGPLAAFPDVRSWVVERVTGPSEIEVVPDEAPTVLRFVPDPGDFAVRFPAGAAGTLIVERVDGAEAELRAVGGAPETVVSASSLEIRNEGAGRYRLRLPDVVTGVWVLVGERGVAITGRQIDGGAAVDLGTGQLR